MSFELRRARDDEELAAAMALRSEVFVGEQGVPPEHEIDEMDAEAIHLVAVDGDGRVRGTCRVFTEGEQAMRVGRLCVDPAARRQGLAVALLGEAEREARAAGAQRMVMNAQTSAMGIYEAIGYEPRGEPFDEVGIEHLAMEKRLA
jgi:ElaA protein